jgi:hypothetical protein
VGLEKVAAWAGGGVFSLRTMAHGEGGPQWFSDGGDGQIRGAVA